MLILTVGNDDHVHTVIWMTYVYLAVDTVFAILVVTQREREAQRDILMTHYNAVDKSSVQQQICGR